MGTPPTAAGDGCEVARRVGAVNAHGTHDWSGRAADEPAPDGIVRLTSRTAFGAAARAGLGDDGGARGHPAMSRAQVVTMGLLVVAYMAFTLLRSALAATMPALKADSGIDVSSAGLGVLQAFGTGAYLSGKLLLGPVTDRVGGRATLLGAGSVAAAMTYLFSVSSHAWLFTVAIMGSQVASGAAWGACSQVIVRWFRPDQLGTVYGTLAISSRGGALLAALSLGVVQSAGLGWRGTWRVAATASLVPLLSTALFLRRKPLGALPPPPGLALCDKAGLCARVRQDGAVTGKGASSTATASFEVDVGGGGGGSSGDFLPSDISGVAAQEVRSERERLLAAPSINASSLHSESGPTSQTMRDNPGLVTLGQDHVSPTSRAIVGEHDSYVHVLSTFLRTRQFWLNLACSFVLTLVFELQYFLPLLLSETEHLTSGPAATYAAAFPAGVMLFQPLGSYMYDRLSPRGGSLYAFGSACVLALSIVLLTMHAQHTIHLSLFLVTALFVTYGAGGGTPYYVPSSLFTMRVAGPHWCATIGNITDAFGYVFAMAFDAAAPRMAGAWGWGSVLMLESIAVVCVLLPAYASFLVQETKDRVQERLVHRRGLHAAAASDDPQ